MSNNEELKPCPFCGGKACTMEEFDGFDTTQYSVQCQNCKMETMLFNERSEAIEAWNRRNCSEFPSNSVSVKQNAKNALIPYIKSLYPSAKDDAIENVADYVLYIIEDGCDIFYDAEAWVDGEFDDE